MSIVITHYKRRTCDYDITITDANGDAVTLAAGDKVRIKVWRQGASTLILDLVSGTPTANGSACTAANPTRLTIDQGDAVWTAGIYEIEAAVVDASNTKTKHADTGVFVLHDTPGGDVG